MSKGAGNLPDNESRIPLAYDAMSHDSCLFTEDVRYSNQISQTEHKFWRYRRWVFSYFILVHIAFALTYSAIVRSRVPYPLDALSKGSYCKKDDYFRTDCGALTILQLQQWK